MPYPPYEPLISTPYLTTATDGKVASPFQLTCVRTHPSGVSFVDSNRGLRSAISDVEQLSKSPFGTKKPVVFSETNLSFMSSTAIAGIALGAVELRIRKRLLPAVRLGTSTRWR